MEVESLQVIKDGGSARIVMRTGEEFYVDNRISRSEDDVRGQLFTGYPSTSDAEVISDTSVIKSVIEALEDYGRDSALHNPSRYVELLGNQLGIEAPVKDEPMGYTIVNIHTREVEMIEGYTVMADNGDTQYLTAEEFKQFQNNRNEG